ncbi:MAG: hypothetical protein Q4C06_08845 [Bacillota bacterium]|nr:hypothetical protein [Bacillota bacterium]
MEMVQEGIGLVTTVKDAVTEIKEELNNEEDSSLVKAVKISDTVLDKALDAYSGVGKILENDLIVKVGGLNVTNIMDTQYKNKAVGRTAYGTSLDHVQYAKKGLKFARRMIKASHGRHQLRMANKERLKYLNTDAQKRHQAAKQLRLSKDERTMLEEGYERNTRAGSAARYGSKGRVGMEMTDAILEAAAFVGDQMAGTGEIAFIQKVEKDVMDLIKSISQYFFDKNMARKYFGLEQTKGDTAQVKKVRDNYKTGLQGVFNNIDPNALNPNANVNANISNLDKRLAQRQKKQQDLQKQKPTEKGKDRGYADIDNIHRFDVLKGVYGFKQTNEFSAYSGLSIIHSLLYCASGFGGGMKSNQVAAVAVLKFLKVDDCIGRVDSEAAMKVYNALRDMEYI